MTPGASLAARCHRVLTNDLAPDPYGLIFYSINTLVSDLLFGDPSDGKVLKVYAALQVLMAPNGNNFPLRGRSYLGHLLSHPPLNLLCWYL